MSRISLISASLLLALGCNSDAEPPGAPAASEDPAAEADDAEDRAAAHVVAGYNILTAEVRRGVIDAYMRGVGAELPAVADLGRVRLTNLAVPFDRAVSDARKHFADAKSASADLPLVARAEAMAAAAVAAGEAYRAARRYYEADGYKDDQGAQAPVLHAAFLQALDAYLAALREVSAALEERERAALSKELARFEPTTISYWFRKILIDAKPLVAATRDYGDGSAFIAANDVFQKTAAALEAFAKTKPDAPQQFVAFNRSVTDSMATRAAKLSRSIVDPDAKPYEIDSDTKTLGQYYNGLVQMANNLLQMEARGDLD